MKCIFCDDSDLSIFIMTDNFSNSLIKTNVHGNTCTCTKHKIPPIYQFIYPTRYRRDLTAIWVYGPIFVAKMLFPQNKTMVYKHTIKDHKAYKFIMTFDKILKIDPDNVDEKIKSLLLFL